MGAGDRTYGKDLCRLARSIEKLTCGQVTLDLDCDQDRTFYLHVTPDGGYYKGATCKLKVHVPTSYPAHAPHVTCVNSIYHPNIDTQSPENEVCVNLLEADWQPEVGLDGCVMAVLYLFHNPNQEDALSPVFDGRPMKEQEFADNVKASLRGEVVEGFKFDQLVGDLGQELVVSVKVSENLNCSSEMFKNGNCRMNQIELYSRNKPAPGDKMWCAKVKDDGQQ